MNSNNFSLESFLETGGETRHYSLGNVAEIKRVYDNRSTSTEDYIRGGIESFGSATQHTMFVAMSLEGYSTTVKESAKILTEVMDAKKRSVEGFSNLENIPNNPWAYALEGKMSEFWKNVWDAILTAVRRVMAGIANIIKWVRNALMSAGTKTMQKDYDRYKANRSKVDAALKGSKIKITTMPWRFNNLGDLKKDLTKICGTVVNASKIGWAADTDKIYTALEVCDFKKIKTEEEFKKFISKHFRAGANINSGTKWLATYFAAIEKKIQESNAANQKAIGGKTKMFGTSKALVYSVFTKTESGEKPASVKMSAKELQKMSNNFEILSLAWFTSNVKDVLATATQAQKDLTKLTNTLEKVARKFKSVTESERNAKVNSLSQASAKLSNARIRYNSFYSGALLDAEFMVLSFRGRVHMALKEGLKLANVADKKAAKENKKSGESLMATTDFFDALN